MYRSSFYFFLRYLLVPAYCIVGLLCSLGVVSCNRVPLQGDESLEEIWLVASKTTTIQGQQYFFIKKGESKVWELFGGSIDNFTYQSGNEYLIRIKLSPDASGCYNNRHTLVSVLS